MDNFKEKVLYSVIILVVVFGVVGTIIVAPSLARWGAAQAPARTITISAQGKTTATPDLAEVSFSVISQGKDPSALNDDNNKKMSSVIDFVKSLNIASSDIATVNYDLEPNYETQTVTSPVSVSAGVMSSAMIPATRTVSSNTITGYTLTQTVEVKIRDFTNIAKLLGGLPPLGINQIGGVSFTFDDPEKFLAIARGDALTQAKEKAAEIAGETGVSLGDVVNVQEYGNIPYPMNYAAKTMGVGMSSAPIAPQIQPGTQDVTDQVTVIYALK